MTTECNAREFDFQALGGRAVTARFDGGAITSDAGSLLLREVEAKTGILDTLASLLGFDVFDLRILSRKHESTKSRKGVQKKIGVESAPRRASLHIFRVFVLSVFRNYPLNHHRL
jgi:hypothetical protein